MWWHPAVPQKLKELHQAGYKLVIFTNQLGITKGKSRASDIQGKIQDLSAELGIPLQAFVAIDDDKWRKPSTAMWDHFVQHHNGGVPVDMQQSFYCGDAAGTQAPNLSRAGAPTNADRWCALPVAWDRTTQG
jgi:bifunctional polynucleotide phosphatase/kinase